MKTDRDRFWDFVAERHAIWRRRTLEGQPPPWTEDHVLATQHFTNMYRQLDPGTQYARLRILERIAPSSERLFNLMVYRLAFREETVEAYGWLRPQEFDPVAFIEAVDSVPNPFTPAYMVCGYRGFMDGERKIVILAQIFANAAERWPNFARSAQSQPDRKSTHKVLQSLYGWGPFVAFQVLVDGSYPGPQRLFAHDNNGWAYAGPGTLRGLALVEGKRVRQKEVNRRLKELGDEQLLELPRRGFEPHPLYGWLDRSNLSNACCEFSKYMRLREGARGAKKRPFDPEARTRSPDWSL